MTEESIEYNYGQYNHTAYLIAICDYETNNIVGADIWSSPEYEQPRCLSKVMTYIVFSMKGESFQKAKDQMIKHLISSFEVTGNDRYYRFLKLIPNLNL
jgi:hypothetical protein